jgi:tape measure domain-containing protein
MAIQTLAEAALLVKPDFSRAEGDVRASARRTGAAAGQEMGNSFGTKFTSTLKSFAGKAGQAMKFVGGSLIAGTAAAVTFGIKTAASLEQAEIGFQTLLGSGKKSRAFLANLQKFAASTPFELPGLIESSRTLLGVGLDAKKVIPTLTAFGDAAGAVGVGQENFQRIMLATSQAISAGRFQTEDLNQITENGIPIWGVLSRAMHKPVPELRKLASDGKLLAKDVLPLLNKQMEKDYGGAMAKQSQTLAGVWSTLKDTVSIGLANALKPLVPLLTEITPKAAALASQWLARAGVAIANAVEAYKRGDIGKSGVVKALADIRQRAVELWPAIQGQLIPAFQSLKANGGKGLSDTIQVTATVMRFMADHVDLLAKALPYLVAALALNKVAQIGVNVAEAISPALKIAELIATRQQTVAMRAHTAALEGNTVAMRLNAGSTTAEVAAENVGIIARIRATAVTIAQRTATIAVTIAQKAAAIASYALGVAIQFATGPIGLIIIGIGLLVGVIIYLYKHNATAKRIIDQAWAGIKATISAVGGWLTGTLFPSIKRAIDQGSAAFQAIGRVARVVWGGIRTYIGDQVNAVLIVVRALRTFIGTTLPNAFRSGVDAIRNAWSKLQDAAKRPVAFVVNQVINPLIGGFNKVAGVFGVDKIPTIGGFAEGGRIPGAPSSRDNRLAWLKNGAGKALGTIQVATGEFIVNARDTAKALPLLRWINDGMRGGPGEVTRRLGRPMVREPGDGSEGWAFAKGGLVGFLGDVWDTVSNPSKLVTKPLDALLNKIPGGGTIRDFVRGMGKKLLGGFLDWMKGHGGGAGGSVGAAQAFVKAQAGKPYVWASAGPGGYDCSGIVSAVYNVMKGKNPYSHTFSTESLPGRWFNTSGRIGPLVAGWSHPGQAPASASVGHMAGMIGGLPFESTGSRGVRVGSAARRVNDFANIGVARAAGGLVEIAKVARADFGRVTLERGNNLIYNGTGAPEPLETKAEGVAGRMHPDDIAALAGAIGAVLSRALLSTVPATRTAARQTGGRGIR